MPGLEFLPFLSAMWPANSFPHPWAMPLPHKVVHIVGLGIKLEPHLVIGGLNLTKARPHYGVPAVFNVLLSRPEVMIKFRHTLGGGRDRSAMIKATRVFVQFPGVPIHLGHHAPLLIPLKWSWKFRQ